VCLGRETTPEHAVERGTLGAPLMLFVVKSDPHPCTRSSGCALSAIDSIRVLSSHGITIKIIL
jgi:hypothetical protein